MSPNDEAILVELEYFGDALAGRTQVVDDDAIHAHHGANVCELKVGEKRKCSGPIGADGLLAAQAAFPVAHDLNDNRRKHLEFIGVV